MERITSTAQEVAELLASAHRDIEVKLRAVADTRGAERDSAFTALRRLLAAHEAAEETYIHPLGSSSLSEERVREEHEARDVITRLEAIDPATQAFDDAFAKFAVAVKNHERAEEREELPKLTKGASPEELGRMHNALQFVPELAEQRGGPIEPDAGYASMLASARAEFAALANQVG